MIVKCQTKLWLCISSESLQFESTTCLIYESILFKYFSFLFFRFYNSGKSETQKTQPLTRALFTADLERIRTQALIRLKIGLLEKKSILQFFFSALFFSSILLSSLHTELTFFAQTTSNLVGAQPLSLPIRAQFSSALCDATKEDGDEKDRLLRLAQTIEMTLRSIGQRRGPRCSFRKNEYDLDWKRRRRTASNEKRRKNEIVGIAIAMNQ